MEDKRVLVIHPDDRSTDFLKLIYKDKDYDVINFKGSDNSSGISLLYEDPDYCYCKVLETIDLYDKIILLGHGTPGGLLNPKAGGYLVDDAAADILRKKEVVSVWCFSDKFFRGNNIFNNQFHTGMIISETLEQLIMLGRIYLDNKQQLKNMEKFATIIGECIEDTPENMKKHVLENYIGEDPVTQFNRDNILVF